MSAGPFHGKTLRQVNSQPHSTISHLSSQKKEKASSDFCHVDLVTPTKDSGLLKIHSAHAVKSDGCTKDNQSLCMRSITNRFLSQTLRRPSNNLSVNTRHDKTADSPSLPFDWQLIFTVCTNLHKRSTSPTILTSESRMSVAVRVAVHPEAQMLRCSHEHCTFL